MAAFAPAAQLAALDAMPAADQLAAARRALDEHQWERAAALAALASARDRSSSEAPKLVGLARFRAHEPDRAVAPFARAVALVPASATLRFDLAGALYQSGHFADAEARYLEAAARDPKLAPLALYDAGLAALDGGARAHAIAHLDAAQQAARAAGQAPVAEAARARLQSLTPSSERAVAPALLRLTHAGTEAIRARRYGVAVADYRHALDAAIAENARAADRAELEYDLGNALWRANDLVAAARALTAAVELAPGEAEFRYLLGLVHFDAGADQDAKAALARALALGLPPAESERAHDILRALAETRRGETSRVFVELRVAAGFDTNVPQSGTVVTAQHPSAESSEAPFVEADFDFFWRPAGTARDGLSLEYRFGQLAYLSSDLDLYSLQEHDLALVGAWTPAPRLTLELGADGYALFSGVETFAPFQAGASVGPRITVREPHGLETRLRAQHIFKHALDPTYAYLGGNRDEAGLAELWRDPKDRVSLGYLFSREDIGVQQVQLGLLDLPVAAPGSFDPDAVWFIPYSYFSHELTLAGARDLPRDFYASATLGYEHRDYDQAAHLVAPDGTPSNYRLRRDDRFALDLSLRHPIAFGFDVELGYTLVVNRSTIDNTRASTPLDYDDKDYVKQVVQVDFGFVY